MQCWIITYSSEQEPKLEDELVSELPKPDIFEATSKFSTYLQGKATSFQEAIKLGESHIPKSQGWIFHRRLKGNTSEF